MDYRVWQANSPDLYCVLGYLENVEAPHQLKRGLSRSNDFPGDACFRMRADRPKAKKLADNIDNLDSMVVVSDRLKRFVESKSPPMTEFLPVSIIDHKNKMARSDYYIVNPCMVQDCIDVKASADLEWNEIDSEMICGCTSLVLDRDRIDSAFTLFRPKHLPMIVLIGSELSEAIEDAEFSGPYFFECEEFMV